MTIRLDEAEITEKMPGAAGYIARKHLDIWAAYASLGNATAAARPLTDREQRLVKLALAVGAGSEGTVHSQTRRARSEGIEPGALDQIALMEIGPRGRPRAVAAKTWIEDIAA